MPVILKCIPFYYLVQHCWFQCLWAPLVLSMQNNKHPSESAMCKGSMLTFVIVAGFVAAIFCQGQWLPSRKRITRRRRKLFIYILQSKLEVMTCCNVLLMYYSRVPIFNPAHAPKAQLKGESHKLLYMNSIIMPNRLQKTLRISGRRLATGAIPLLQRVVARVLRY